MSLEKAEKIGITEVVKAKRKSTGVNPVLDPLAGSSQEREFFGRELLSAVVPLGFSAVTAAADDVAGFIVVAVVGAVVVAGPADVALELAAIARGETAVGVRLAERTEGVGEIVEFGVDGDGHFTEADHESEDTDGRDEDQFGRNDETSFVIPQGVQAIHVRVPLRERKVREIYRRP